MKNLIVILSLLTLLFTTSFDVEARKKFGSKKRGKTPETQQTAQKQQTDTKTIAPATKPKSNKKGIMAGIFGGLATGTTTETQDLLLECAFFAPLAIAITVCSLTAPNCSRMLSSTFNNCVFIAFE